MKDAQSVAEGRGKRPGREAARAVTALPNPLVEMVDVPADLPPITHAELVAFLNARESFLFARAEYERKRAELVLKLSLSCELDIFPDSLELGPDGDTLHAVERSSETPRNITDRRT